MSIALPSWNYSDAGRWKSLRVQRVAPLLHWIISFRTYLQRRVNVHLEICLRNSCNSGCKKEQYWQQFFFRVIIFEFLWHLNSFDFFNSCEPSNNYYHLSNKREVTLTDFGKFHPAQNKNPPCMFIDFITKMSYCFIQSQYSNKT